MSRERDALIARILELNATASSAFLAQFDDIALRDYLDHLLWSRAPRGTARWPGSDADTGYRTCA